MTARKVSMMTEEDLVEVIREAVRAEFMAAGLRMDTLDNQEAVREDMRFLRRLRSKADSISSKIGMAVILAVVAAGMGFLWNGFTNSLK